MTHQPDAEVYDRRVTFLPPPRMLSRGDAAGYLNVSRATLDRIVQRGELHPIRIGRRPRFRVADLQRYLEEGGP